jgi:hypothetical protein
VSFRVSLEGLGAPLRGIKRQSRKSRKKQPLRTPIWGSFGPAGRFDHCGGTFRLILAVWGTLWGSFASFGWFGEHFWDHLGTPAAPFGSIWELLVTFLASFGTSWGHFGHPWGDLGRPGGPKSNMRPGNPKNGPFLESFWEGFGRSKPPQKTRSNKCAKNNKNDCIATRSATKKIWAGSVFVCFCCSLRWMFTLIVFSILSSFSSGGVNI